MNTLTTIRKTLLLIAILLLLIGFINAITGCKSVEDAVRTKGTTPATLVKVRAIMKGYKYTFVTDAKDTLVRIKSTYQSGMKIGECYLVVNE